jgi:hypothetical protein
VSKFTIALLSDMLDECGEDAVKTLLSTYLCPINQDIESFLQSKAIEFNRQKISSTHLVFANVSHVPVLVGYFTLANKCTSIPIGNISNSLKRVFLRYGVEDKQEASIQVALPLIAQFGKNFVNNSEKLITGNSLMLMVIERVRHVQKIIGGSLVFLECEDVPELISFYENNEFKRFNEILSDEIEPTTGNKKKYIQMIRRLK